MAGSTSNRSVGPQRGSARFPVGHEDPGRRIEDRPPAGGARSNPRARAEEVRLAGPPGRLGDVVARLGSELLRVMVYGVMPDVVRQRFDVPLTNADRVAFTSVCAALRASGPAVRRGALDGLWPEGTPHLDPRDRDTVVVAGPNPRQRRRRTSPEPEPVT
jgi:hypothetical protein